MGLAQGGDHTFIRGSIGVSMCEIKVIPLWRSKCVRETHPGWNGAGRCMDVATRFALNVALLELCELGMKAEKRVRFPHHRQVPERQLVDGGLHDSMRTCTTTTTFTSQARHGHGLRMRTTTTTMREGEWQAVIARQSKRIRPTRSRSTRVSLLVVLMFFISDEGAK